MILDAYTRTAEAGFLRAERIGIIGGLNEPCAGFCGIPEPSFCHGCNLRAHNPGGAGCRRALSSLAFSQSLIMGGARALAAQSRSLALRRLLPPLLPPPPLTLCFAALISVCWPLAV